MAAWVSSAPPLAKPHFVNRTLRFVNATRAGRWAVWAVFAAMAATILGPFGTDNLPLGQRAAFWLLLIGWNAAKWAMIVRVLLPRSAKWLVVMLTGNAVMLLTIPLEVTIVIRVLLGADPAPLHDIALRTVALSLIGLAGVLLAMQWLRKDPVPTAAATPLPEARFPGTVVRLTEISAIIADDHYVHLHLLDGASLLLHTRFRDAVAEVSGIAGAQIHRGAWVAETCVKSVRRRDGRWLVTLASGQEMPVSRQHVARLRELGWLGPRPLPAPMVIG